MTVHTGPPGQTQVGDLDDQAAEAYIRCRQGPWSAADQSALEARLRQDAAFAEAFGRAGRLWQSVDTQAAQPELMVMREQAMARARRHNVGRWHGTERRRWRSAAAVAAVAVIGGVVALWLTQVDPPGTYQTGLGEQQVVDLDDRSRIALDAATRLRVRYSDDARLVELYEGQAQFIVAKDPTRPFKVRAGDRTVVALGTVFTVEYVDRQMRVAMIEGRVAVLPSSRSPSHAPSVLASQRPNDGGATPPAGNEPPGNIDRIAANQSVELGAGQGLQVADDGSATLASGVDINAVTAWRRGQVVFDGVPLAEAVRRLNRYSRLQVEIEDPALAALQISGVFEAGDAHAFADAVQAYLPVTADYADARTVRLRTRR